MKCILVDEKRCRPEDLAGLKKNVMAAIVRVEQANGASSLGKVVRDMKEWLSGPEDRELCRDLRPLPGPPGSELEVRPKTPGRRESWDEPATSSA
jgi:hypothetical protein